MESDKLEISTATRVRKKPKWVWAIIILLPFLALSFFLQVLQPLKVAASSMAPTIVANDHVVVNQSSYWFSKPKRGDLIAFSTRGIPQIMMRANAGESYYVKRLVGFPGEKISITENGDLLVDGKVVSELAMHKYTIIPSASEFVVPENTYFAFGDNSENSWDSRGWGGVPQEDVIGKVVFCYRPLSRMAFVD